MWLCKIDRSEKRNLRNIFEAFVELMIPTQNHLDNIVNSILKTQLRTAVILSFQLIRIEVYQSKKSADSVNDYFESRSETLNWFD